MKKIIIATNNLHKVREYSQIFGTDIKLITLKEIGFTDEIVEDGKTFCENSLIKCNAVYKKFKMPVLADDSGLCVEALNNEPGIFSARYGGENLTDKQRYKYLLSKIQGITNRKASFVCALSLLVSKNRLFFVEEEFEGEIATSPMGENGFGYDPIFFLKRYNKSVAQLPDDQKNKISHRAKAAKIMNKIIKEINL